MKGYISSLNLVEEINNKLNNNIPIDFGEERDLISLDGLKKIEWNDKEKFIYNIFIKYCYDWSDVDYYKIEKRLFLNDKGRLNFLPLIIELNKFLISNFKKEYLEYNKMLVYVDKKEILTLDFQFILKSIIATKSPSENNEYMISGFIQNTIDILQKSFYQSKKIEIFFFGKNDYFKL